MYRNIDKIFRVIVHKNNRKVFCRSKNIYSQVRVRTSKTKKTLPPNLARLLDSERDITWNNLWPVLPCLFSLLPPPVDAIYNERPTQRGALDRLTSSMLPV